MTTTEIVSAIDEEITRLQQARSLLAAVPDVSIPTLEIKRRGRPPGKAAPKAASVKQARTMSEEGRARIAAAQKARWAAKKKADRKAAGVAASPVTPKQVKAPAKKAAEKHAAVVVKSTGTKKALTLAKKVAAPVKKAAARKVPASRPASAAKKAAAPAEKKPVQEDVLQGGPNAETTPPQSGTEASPEV